MPKMVTLEINPNHKPAKGGAPAFKVLKDTFRPKKQAYVTAMENVKNSKGALRIKAEAVATAPIVTQLEDTPDDQLKLMMLNAGIIPEGKVTRDEAIALLREKMNSIDFGDAAET